MLMGHLNQCVILPNVWIQLNLTKNRGRRQLKLGHLTGLGIRGQIFCIILRRYRLMALKSKKMWAQDRQIYLV